MGIADRDHEEGSPPHTGFLEVIGEESPQYKGMRPSEKTNTKNRGNWKWSVFPGVWQVSVTDMPSLRILPPCSVPGPRTQNGRAAYSPQPNEKKCDRFWLGDGQQGYLPVE
jgi:hypothetical protein